LLSNDAHSANHFCLVQAGVMNINERKRSSPAHEPAKQLQTAILSIHEWIL